MDRGSSQKIFLLRMLNITFRKNHRKKNKPVTRAGYLSANPWGFASL
uniref:Uncharacterized protein n=1 Tax=Arundo donax TaxID=35708 RepID=A0A0A9H6F3_ARUDO